MRHFYDGQVRRYVTQVMRILSNFPVKNNKDELKQVPVLYGDISRQVASILKENSENKILSMPRISVYITGLEYDRERLAEPTFTSKVNVRERYFDKETQQYLHHQGKNYTVERLMPTPYILKLNADICTISNTDQKLQILEQILVWFNPSLEIQTTDNFIDWTSVTVVNLDNIQWSNRNIPVGTESEYDIATLSFNIPIYISPPIKVKKLGVITNIITSIHDESLGDIDKGVSVPEINAFNDYFYAGTHDNSFGKEVNTQLSDNVITNNYKNQSIFVSVDKVELLTYNANDNWEELFEILPDNYQPELSRIFLSSIDLDTTVTGTFIINPTNSRELIVSWDIDSFPQDTVISSSFGTRTSVDYIVDPLRLNPTDIKVPGLRLLILDNISSTQAMEYPKAWINGNGSGFVANANDIIEWDGNKWSVIFDSTHSSEIIYTTNLNTRKQYRFINNEWVLSIDGEYLPSTWRIELNG